MAVDDLVAFLNARYAEAEAMAAVVHIGSCATMTGAAIVYGEPATCDCGAPELIRADVASKRRIVTWALDDDSGERTPIRADGMINGEWGSGDIDPPELTEQLLRLLTTPFAQHPDYRKEWRP